jgi:hypothetical protein
MARVLSNQLGGKYVVLCTANDTIQVSSANATAGEVVTGLTINQVWTGLDSGFWKISRGANTIFITNGSDYYDFSGAGQALTLDPAANVVVESTTANCTLMIDFTKQSTFTSEY